MLIHPNRGGAIVDLADADGAWLELTERLDRSEVRLTAEDLADGWRLAMPGGLFEQSVLRPEEAASRVQDRPTDSVLDLAEELAEDVDRELAATWLVSRGLLPPGRALTWWSEALEGAASRDGVQVADERLHLDAADAGPLPDEPADQLAWVHGQPTRARFEQLDQLGDDGRQALLHAALVRGDADLAAQVVRWPESIQPEMNDPLDRMLSAGHRDLAVRLATSAPDLACPALLADARVNGSDGLCGEVLAALPQRRRAALLMEMLGQALRDPDSLDVTESMIEEYGGHATLAERVEAAGSGAPLPQPEDGRWHDALTWLRGRGSDSTMEMPSLHPTPLLRDSGKLAGRDALQVSISLARALARRHAEGRCGGVRGARLLRSEWRVDLGPPEPGSPAEDVRDAMRLVLDLLVGRLAGADVPDDKTLLAHLYSLAPDVPLDWTAVAVRAFDPDLTRRIPDGLSLWQELATAKAVARVRLDGPVRIGAHLSVGHDTHIGAIKSRLGQTNQDALFFHRHGPVTLLVVADGISISSAGSGNLASALLVQAVASLWEEEAEQLADADTPRLQQFLRDALEAANRSVCETALRLVNGDMHRHIPMGTTVVMALVRGGRAHIANLGDSRVYLVGPDGMAQLTGDGNLMGDWLRARQGGQDTPLEADGAALTAYVGHFDQHDNPEAVTPQLRTVTLLPREHLLLCSDGLTDFAASSPAELSRLVHAALDDTTTVAGACRRLVDNANEGGGGDNITVLMARIDG